MAQIQATEKLQIAMASTQLLQQDVVELKLSPSAIRRARLKHCEIFASKIMSTFDPKVPLVLRWNGKIMEDITGPGRDYVDRLPLLVSGRNIVKLLKVPKLHDGKPTTISQVVTETLDDWG
jgi:hypothetical protein